MNSSPSYRKKNSAAAVTVASRRRAFLSVEDDISEVSATSATELEVTHEEYLRVSRRRTRIDPNLSPLRTNTNAAGGAGVADDAGAGSRSCTGGGVRRSFSSLLGGRQSSGVGGKNRKGASSISPSVSDLGSVDSAARKTVASLETIKASNKQEKPEPSSSPSSPPSGKKEKKRWSKLKRMIGEKLTATHHGSASSVDGVAPATENRQRALSEENVKNHHFKLMGRRVRSSPEKASPTRSTSEKVARQQQAMDDDRIRGRFDGIDILFLGGAYLTVPSAAASDGASDDMLPPWDRAMECKFTGEPPQQTPAEIVLHAVWASSGRDPPEIILDGIGTGPDGRWSVRVVKPTSEKVVEERTPEKSPISSTAVWWNFDSTPPPQLQPTASHDDSLSDDDGRSPVLLLRQLLWGTTHDTTPAEVTRTEAAGSTHSEHSDPMLDVATRCSIPIDIDDDTFIISTREHIQALHDLASASIAERNFEHALRMFKSLLKGLDSVTDPDLRFVKGTTLHNMGLLQLWMGQPSNAAATFSQALDERIKQLPSKHPDLAVTLSRKAAACFGVGRFGEAIAGLKEALAIIPADHLIRAKLLNNLGVIYYFQNDFGGALREFTSGLEIQRDWVEGPVRRENTVYDTAVTLSNMGKVYVETSDNEIASYLYEEALLLETAIFRKDHDLVLTTLTSLAVAEAQKEHFGKALQILQGCLRSQNNRFGVLSAESMNTLGLCSCFHARQGDYENALKCLLTVRKWQKGNLAENHTALMKSKQMQKAIEAKLGKKKKTTFSVTQAFI